MQVILRKEVDRLGFPGDLVSVKPGYARNFLVPRGLAVQATRGALQARDKTVAARDRREEAQRERLTEVARTLQGKVVTLIKRAGSKGKLYGSVTAMDVHEAVLAQLGVDVERRKLAITEAIKSLGDHPRTFTIARGIEATLTLRVVVEGTEAPTEEAAGEAEPASEAPAPEASAE